VARRAGEVAQDTFLHDLRDKQIWANKVVVADPRFIVVSTTGSIPSPQTSSLPLSVPSSIPASPSSTSPHKLGASLLDKQKGILNGFPHKHGIKGQYAVLNTPVPMSRDEPYAQVDLIGETRLYVYPYQFVF
jgi:hypothetical protein